MRTILTLESMVALKYILYLNILFQNFILFSKLQATALTRQTTSGLDGKKAYIISRRFKNAGVMASTRLHVISHVINLCRGPQVTLEEYLSCRLCRFSFLLK